MLYKNKDGNLNDLVGIPFVDGTNSILAHLNTNYYHFHAQSFVYPNHADNVVLTSAAGAWNLGGSIVEVIPENALNISNFDLHWINISDISATSQIQIDIYRGNVGEEVLIGSTRSIRTAVQSRNAPQRIQIPQTLVNTRISCRLSDSTTGTVTCNVSFEGHFYE